MRENGFAWNRTGKNPSVIDINSGKKYRLKTLGVLEDYERYSQEWEQAAERVRQRQEEAERVQEAYQAERKAQEQSREARQPQEEMRDSVSEEFRKEAERISQIPPKTALNTRNEDYKPGLCFSIWRSKRGSKAEKMNMNRLCQP